MVRMNVEMNHLTLTLFVRLRFDHFAVLVVGQITLDDRIFLLEMCSGWRLRKNTQNKHEQKLKSWLIVTLTLTSSEAGWIYRSTVSRNWRSPSTEDTGISNAKGKGTSVHPQHTASGNCIPRQHKIIIDRLPGVFRIKIASSITICRELWTDPVPAIAYGNNRTS